ncbi:peptidase G1, partial [Lanmaoa asiatica]
GTFDTITGTFTVLNPLGSTGAAAAAWVGIDGPNCPATLQIGVDFIVESGQPTYGAWYEWYPANANSFSGISISAGDIISLTVIAWTATSGNVTIGNISNDQVVTEILTSPTLFAVGVRGGWLRITLLMIALSPSPTLVQSRLRTPWPLGRR